MGRRGRGLEIKWGSSIIWPQKPHVMERYRYRGERKGTRQMDKGKEEKKVKGNQTATTYSLRFLSIVLSILGLLDLRSWATRTTFRRRCWSCDTRLLAWLRTIKKSTRPSWRRSLSLDATTGLTKEPTMTINAAQRGDITFVSIYNHHIVNNININNNGNKLHVYFRCCFERRKSFVRWHR